ncbi:hypothetical protein LTR70_006387 [Exophiala xenobiotica]|uniref:Uncharacterized protein n=1 Tax=Lithohypha guttulata TaxID=1690604 RepID=A0ABR0K442_9EURO|nr:hypothetical protein LTR24_007412 [Lithohypha guttulata]KAK5316219.1 hypothetical protein LTR70_006387 [Exophiala xenobiotica]
MWNYFEISAEQRFVKTECVELLMKFGADPTHTIVAEDPPVSMIAYALLVVSADAVKRMLDNGEPFFSASNILESDEVPLLVLANYHASYGTEPYQIPDKFALLLSRGANLHVRDDNGDTCLHVVMLYDPGRIHREELRTRVYQNPVNDKYDGELKDILLLLMTAGADVYARNIYEETPSDIARSWNHEREWREALEECGYDPDEVEDAEEQNISWSSGTDFVRTSQQRPLLSFAEYLEIRKGRHIEEKLDEESEIETGVDEEEIIAENTWESWETKSDGDSGENQELEGDEHSREEHMHWEGSRANAADFRGRDDLESQTALLDAYKASKDKSD